MRKTFDELHKKAISIAKDMDNGCADEKEMFNLIQSLDYRLKQAVENIEKLEKLIILKEIENYNI